MKLLYVIGITIVTLTTAVVVAVSIDHDKVQPFAQPEPVTMSEKAAIRFKPALDVVDGCNPYPAVNAAGETSAGLKASGSPSGDCKGHIGSQIYGRAGWYSDLWAIMYAWYFPKTNIPSRTHHRHDWQNMVVWIDNPEANPPTIKAISIWGDYGNKYTVKHRKLENYRNGSSPKARYGSSRWMTINSLDLAELGDEFGFQDLIMWEQLTDKARSALESTDFGDAKVPFNDATFQTHLDGAWPSGLTRGGY
ncbi:hypothetical protein PHYBOEH_001104 [Phytophthora boehmeriae]|uniref:Uncharacterized protein n=1 Tax=Phytophthora boehmeriae TaxID=109152 RepID=A0A8T1WUV6_9STRA|nr:hypothetical protein PHYBOEH_001104 [Phytophthora boehmeriae]